MDTVEDAVGHLELALRLLDASGEYHAAAYVASALDALNAPRADHDKLSD